MQVGEFGLEGLDELPVVDEVVAGDAGEDLEDSGSGGRGAAAVLGVERQLGQAAFGHGEPDLSFDERLDEHRDEVAAQQPFDPGRVAEEHRRDQLGALELGVTLLEVGSPLVRGEQLGAGHVPIVADQREAAVGGGVGRDLFLVDGEGHTVTDPDGLAVAGVGAGPAAFSCR